MQFKAYIVCIWLFVSVSARSKDASSERWKEISVSNVLDRDPSLKEFIRPNQMARLINQIPLAYLQEFGLNIVTVIDGKASLSCFSDYCQFLDNFNDVGLVRDFINEYSAEMKIQDVYFVVYSRDELHYDTFRSNLGPLQLNSSQLQRIYDHYYELMMQLPAVRMSVDLGDSLLEQNKFLIPDSYMLQGFRWLDKVVTIRSSGIWENTLAESLEASRSIKWQEKIPKVFWRGIDTGRAFVIPMDEIWEHPEKYYPRIELVRLSKEHPDKIDACLTGLRSEDIERFRKAGLQNQLTKKRSSLKDHIKYRYLVSVDGWTAAWVRVPWILASNSILLKQESLKVEWFDYALKPMVHYYPVKSDLSDLVEAVDFLETHQELAQQIVRNANIFVDQFFTRDKIREAAMKVFREYAQAQNHTFSAADRELIQTHGRPYHTFAHLSDSRKQSLLNELREWRRIYWTTGLAIISVMLLIWTLKSIRNIIQRLLTNRQYERIDLADANGL